MKDHKSLTFHRLLFEPLGRSLLAREGQTVLEAARANGMDLRSECGGRGHCGKCNVSGSPPECLSPVSAIEEDRIPPDEIAEGQRLACQARVMAPGTITVSHDPFMDIEEASGKTGVKGTYAIDPMVERFYLPACSLANREQIRDMVHHTVCRATQVTDKRVYFRDLGAIREISGISESRGPITIVSHRLKGVTAVLAGEHKKSLGLALDLGTTTLAAYLCDLRTGAILTAAASSNPQRLLGEDVISRMDFASKDEKGTQTLHKLMIKRVNLLIGRCLESVGGHSQDIDEVVAAGNTTMQHLFVALNPRSLGVSPYLPVSISSRDLKASDLGLDLNPGTNVYLFPVVSGFIGGDTLSVILSERPHEMEEPSLIVDIGTNGEVVLGNRDQLWATSCATGPAFEGAQVTCGMRAAQGAIHRISIEPSSLRVSCQVIGDPEERRPRGICGSGIIDLLAGMGRTGVLLSNGRIREGFPGVMCDGEGVGRKFLVAPAEETHTGEDIFIALSDIRQIQLAKAALCAGIRILMHKTGITNVGRIVLTGAFGARFNWRNAFYIGMLPRRLQNTPVEIVENAAGVGAVMALLDRRRRREVLALQRDIRFVELAGDPEFSSEFTAAINFPFEKGLSDQHID
jgi:uncharacterized 2Fe-2S/4Fe-4S cluster protein (DUF4445 family)